MEYLPAVILTVLIAAFAGRYIQLCIQDEKNGKSQGVNMKSLPKTGLAGVTYYVDGKGYQYIMESWWAV